MGIIKAVKLIYEYVSKDEHGDVESVTQAIQGVDLDIQAGQFIAILGHNGSGKSTLAKLSAGLLSPSNGKIFIYDELLTPKNVQLLRKHIGIVFQNPDNQFIGSSVEDDIAFGLENQNIPREEMVIKIYHAKKW